MQLDFIANNKESVAVVPSVHTADADGSSVDMLGFNAVTFCAILGDSADTLGPTVAIELEVEESDDDSSFEDVADADLQGYVARALNRRTTRDKYGRQNRNRDCAHMEPASPGDRAAMDGQSDDHDQSTRRK